MLVKWFVKGYPAKRIVKTIDLSYPTVLKALEVLRLSIIANQPDAQLWLDLVDYRQGTYTKDAKQNPVVFGVIESDRLVQIEIMEDLPINSLIGLNPKMVRRGAIYYTDEFSPYSFLLFHDHAQIHSLQLDSWRQTRRINHESDFLKFTKQSINRHRGITDKKFPQYLKEIEFRYNRRSQPFFKELCHFLVSFVPQSGAGDPPASHKYER